jgi:hypothetical protein
MGMSEDFFAMFEDAIEDAYQKGELPRELMYAHEASKITKTCHGDLCILKGMLDEFNPEAIPTINDVVLFKHLLSTIVIQASLVSDSAERLHKKYPDISSQEGGDK